MNLTIHQRTEDDNISQFGTRWSFYVDETIEEPVSVKTIELPQNILILNPNLIIPKNTVYWVTADRLCYLLNDDGTRVTEDVTDENGNTTTRDKVVEINATKRTPFKNDDKLQSANIFETPLPDVPLLQYKIDEKDFIITTSRILPEILSMDSVVWALYDDKLNLIEAVSTSGEDILTYRVDGTKISDNNTITVTAIHMSEGIASPIAKIEIDVNDRIKVISNTRNVIPTVDYLLKYTESIDDLVVTGIVLYNKDLNIKVKELENIESSILISSELIEPNTNYEVVFTMQDPKNRSATDEETIEFFTMPIATTFLYDRFYEYKNDLKLVSSADVKKIFGHIEKTFDGRFPYFDGTNLTWGTMENGEIKPLDGIVIKEGYDKDSSHYQLPYNEFLSLYMNDANNAVIAEYNRDEYSQLKVETVWSKTISNAVNTMQVSFVRQNSTLYYPTNNGIKKMVLRDEDTVPVEETMPVRPDQVVSGTKFISNGKDLLVMGGSENIYVFNEDINRYRFLTVLPDELLGVELDLVVMVNRDVLIVPLDCEKDVVGILDYKTKDVTVKQMRTPLYNIKGVLKSNGVIFLHDNNNKGAYYK